MTLARGKWSRFVLWAIFALLYFASARLCVAVSALVANISWVLYIPAGLSLTASLLWGRRVWPAVFAGEFLLCVTTKQPLSGAVIMAAGNALDAALAGWWFHDRLGHRIEFDRLRDVVRLLLAELLVLQPLSTGMGMLALTVTGQMPPEQLWSSASAWYAANVFAQFVIAPTALAWIRWKTPVQNRREATELAGLTVLVLIVGALGPGRWAIRGLPLPVALILAFPLLVWASVRFVPSVALSLGTVLGLFAFDAALSGYGPLRDQPIGDQMFYLNVFMGVCLGTALFLATAMGQERRFKEEQARLIAELKATANQVRRLTDFVTFCAWTGRVRWNDEWISVERFLNERYNLTISHGISEEAVAKLLQEMPPVAGQRPEPNEPARSGIGSSRGDEAGAAR